MSDRVFLDTNVLIYAIESEGPEPDKTAAAQALAKREAVVISTQVLGEFYRAVISPKRKSPLDHREATSWIQFWKRYEVKGITVPHVDLALEITDRFGIGFFDALILSAARVAGCAIVYSEDLSDGQDYDGVTVENPFQ